jgi:GNAT superfamily N-acetyltransferase
MRNKRNATDASDEPEPKVPRSPAKAQLDGLEITCKIMRKEEEFLALHDELFKEWMSNLEKGDESGFFYNRRMLLSAFQSGALYMQEILKTDERFRLRQLCAREVTGHIQEGMLPAFCVAEDGVCIMVWVHERFRRNGIARRFMSELGIQASSEQIKGSEKFWQQVDINEE